MHIIELQPAPPPLRTSHSDADGFALAEQIGEALAARHARIEQVALRYGGVCWVTTDIKTAGYSELLGVLKLVSTDQDAGA